MTIFSATEFKFSFQMPISNQRFRQLADNANPGPGKRQETGSKSDPVTSGLLSRPALFRQYQQSTTGFALRRAALFCPDFGSHPARPQPYCPLAPIGELGVLRPQHAGEQY